jgi:hypothetical protein
MVGWKTEGGFYKSRFLLEKNLPHLINSGDVKNLDDKEMLYHVIKIWYCMGKTYFDVLLKEAGKLKEPHKSIVISSGIMGFMDSSIIFFRDNIKNLGIKDVDKIIFDIKKKRDLL